MIQAVLLLQGKWGNGVLAQPSRFAAESGFQNQSNQPRMPNRLAIHILNYLWHRMPCYHRCAYKAETSLSSP